MSFQDHFEDTQADEPSYSWTQLVGGSRQAVAEELAGRIVRGRCPDRYYQAWMEAKEHGSKLFGNMRRGFEHIVSDVLQLPNQADDPPPEHVQGYVAEALWHALSQDHAHRNPVELIEWGWNPTDPGGDGLIIHRQHRDLAFRLWEIKKTTSSGGISGTVGRASDQLKRRAPSYLARWMKVGQERTSGDVREFFGYLLDHWFDASTRASVGVAVASSTESPPDPCFHQLPTDFPDFCAPSRLRGLLTQVDDFHGFCQLVREHVWIAL